MPRKSFLYYLFSGNKKPLYVDDNGHVQEGSEDYLKPNGQPACLKKSPSGWKDVLVKYARNNTWLGLFRDMTVPLKFVKDGARILNNRVWMFGIEAICYLGILKLDRLNLPYKYESWYFSEIDFSKYKETETGAQVSALEGGLSKYLKANQGTVYEIPIDLDPEHVNILMDGMEFDFNRTYGVPSDQACIGTLLYYLGMIETSREGNPLNVLFQDILPGINSSVYPNDNYFVKTDDARDLRIHGDITFYYNKSVHPVLRLEVNDGVSGSSTQYDLVPFSGSGGTAGETKTFTFDSTITVPAGNRVHMKLFGGSGGDPTTQFTVKDGNILVDYVYRYRSTYIKALYPYRLLGKLIEKASDGKFTIVSSTWLSAMKDYVITSGDALRGIVTDNSDPSHPIKGAVIKTSINDFFKSFFARFSCGMGIDSTVPGLDDKLRIELINYFFSSATIVDLGQVSNAELSYAEDLSFNTIKAGYEKQNYSDANGRYETNQGQQWTTPVTRIVKELDMKSPYRADPFGIETLRINFEQKKTSDSSSDNDTFFLNMGTESFIDDSVTPNITYYKLNRPAYSSVTGIPHPDSAFNLELTPKKGLLNNGAWLHSFMDKMDAGVIKFQSADKNAELSTTLAGITVAEKEDIQIGSLAAKLVLPWYISFTTQAPVNLLAILNSNPYGKIKFTWNGKIWYGYLWDGGIKPGDNDVQVWKLLSSPENDLSKFNESF